MRKGAGSASGETCFVCSRKVYPAERLIAGGRLFHRKSAGHRGCFNCYQCGVALSAANFSSAGSRVYCNAHFRQLFAEHGDYRFAFDGDEKAAEAATKEAAEAAAVEEEEAKTAETTAAASEMAAEEATNAPAAADEDGEATCYLSGELQLPFTLEEAWLRVRDPAAPSDWLIVGYAMRADGVTEDPTLLEIVGSGDGGLSACVESLGRNPACASRVLWGGLRVKAIDTRGMTSCERPKFVFFTHMASGVSTRSRTRGLLHTGAVAEVLQGAHCAFEVEEQADLAPAIIAAKLLHSAGAHKPNAYDFGGGLIVRQEYYAS